MATPALLDKDALMLDPQVENIIMRAQEPFKLWQTASSIRITL